MTTTVVPNYAMPAIRTLAEYDHWLLWKRVWRGNESTKPPFALGWTKASTTDPSTWTTLERALRAVPSPGHDRGVGFVFTAADPFAGIDIDGCRDPTTGALSEWARVLVDSVDSYTEVSPSGTGVKIVAEGRLPQAGRKAELRDVERMSYKQPAIEMYATARYFTITGEHLEGTPETIEPRQAALDELFARFFPDQREKREKREKSGDAPSGPGLTDDEVLELAFGARNGARIRALYLDGDISAYDDDDSRADLALASLLAFYTGDDAEQLWRLIQASALYRTKWDRLDYRERTLGAAIDGLTAVYSRPAVRNGVVPDAGPRVRVGRVEVDTDTGAVNVDRDEWPAPMAEAAFYGPLGAFVKAAALETEADIAAVLLMCMSAISALFDPHTHMRAGNANHPIRINAVLVGPTALGRKGTAGKIAEAVIRQAEDGFIGKVVEGLSSGEGLLWTIRDPISKHDTKTGVETVIDPGVVDKRLWVCETEFATTLRVLQRDGNSLSPIIRRAWDIGPDGVLRSLTKNSPAKATGAHIAVAGHITRHELLESIEHVDLVNGFANRFLWAAARRSRVLPFGEEVNSTLVNDFAELVRDARDWTAERHRMAWALDARAAWAEVYSRLGSDQDDLFSAVTARGAPQILRMTQLYAALEGNDLLQPAHLEAAVAVWEYAERTCRWVFGDSLGDPLADEILAALRRGGPMSRTDIYDLFKRHERRSRIEQALGRLLIAGLAKCLKETTDGRPAEIWTAT